jgi:hypothetical protein
MSHSVAPEFVVPVTFLLRNITGWRRIVHNNLRKQLRLKPLKITRPFLVVIDAHGKTDGTIVVPGKIWKTLPGIHDITGLGDVVLPSLRATLIGDGLGRAVNATGPAVITKLGDARVYWFIGLEGN